MLNRSLITKCAGLVLLFVQTVAMACAVEPRREIPKDNWVGIYFESIDAVAAKAGLISLRNAVPARDHRELRLWLGFGLSPLRGYVVTCEHGEWKGYEINGQLRSQKPQISELKPRTTWDTAWSALCEKQLLTLPDFSTLAKSNYTVFDGGCVVVEVFSDQCYRTYMYPNAWAFDNPECRQVEALIATFLREFKGGDGKTRDRKFLTSLEIRSLAARLPLLQYPIATGSFLAALPVNLHERDLRGDGGISGIEDAWWSEWPLTNRADPRGYFALVGYLAKASHSDLKGETIIRHAEVVFHDRELEQALVLQPQDYPAKRTAAPRSK
jgi:hypothetical protein